MGIVAFSVPTIVNPIINGANGMYKFSMIESPINNLQLCRRRWRIGARVPNSRRLRCSISGSNGDEEQLDSPQELRVPSHWLEPSRAQEVNKSLSKVENWA